MAFSYLKSGPGAIFSFRRRDRPSKLSGMIKRWLPWLIAISLFGGVSLSAADKLSVSPGDMLTQAQKLIREKNYPAAIDLCQNMIETYPDSPASDKYLYTLARAYELSGNFKKAGDLLTSFHSKFPKSHYLAYASHLLGNSLYRQGKTDAAFRSYLTASESTTDDQLKQLSERSLLAMVENGYLPPDTVVSRLPQDIACGVKIRMATLVKGKWSRDKIDKFLAGCPGAAFVPAPKDRTGEPSLTVGVLLPLTGPYAKYGQALLDGASLAVDAARKKGIPIDLRVFDSKADHVTAARGALAMADEGVDVVFGPLLSDVSATVASALACRRIPLLVPAATQAGFTELSPYCFQMSVNSATIGRGLAQYAVRRGMKRIAVFSPTTLDEMTMAESFAAEVVRLGAPAPVVEKFRPEETDFTAVIKDLKRIISGAPSDSAVFITVQGDTLKPGEEPISLDGIFAAATPAQLNLLVPQLDFNKVQGDYLGSDDWDNETVRKLDEKIIHNPVFYSSAAAAKSSRAFDSLSIIYAARLTGRPDRLTALGFDAITILANAWKNGSRGPAEIYQYLETVTGYAGASGKITFGRSRTNLELPLFTIQRGAVVPLSQATQVEEKPEDEIPADSTDLDDNK